MSSEPNYCGSEGAADSFTELRIAAVFVIFAGSSSGALFPVLARKTTRLNVPTCAYDFAKFFGSGVIIATAFVHLLNPALNELGSPCLSPAWQEYPYALALAMFSLFSIFIVEFIAFRWGTAKLSALGVNHDAHGHGLGSHAAHGPEGASPTRSTLGESGFDKSSQDWQDRDQYALAQIIGVFILEFGVLLHSLLIGLTLAVDPAFKVLFVVILFHQTFEGLGLGSRLAFLDVPPRYNFVPVCAAMLYAVMTPVGIAVGLGVRTTYNPGSTAALIVSGVLDSISAGILLYTGMVELLAHEFLFNKDMIDASNGKVAYALACMLFGTGLMALLGRWA